MVFGKNSDALVKLDESIQIKLTAPMTRTVLQGKFLVAWRGNRPAAFFKVDEVQDM